ncbi:hypothetical protein HC928_25450 [bacterium]|nr:hypothetical protein [bacterium]
MSEQQMENFSQIVQAVKQAANLCRRVQQTDVASVEKPGREPVTIADFGSQAIICRTIARITPMMRLSPKSRANTLPKT